MLFLHFCIEFYLFISFNEICSYILPLCLSLIFLHKYWYNTCSICLRISAYFYICNIFYCFIALNFHFESQCIPTPLAWYAHYLPPWLLKLGVVGTFVIEIPIPFLFFAPLRSLRLFAFYTQVSKLFYFFYSNIFNIF